MAASETSVLVKVDDRQLRLSNLTKVLYPEDGVTKGEIIEYYTRIAPVLLPHVAGRPLTTIRFPNGTAGHKFFEKNAPRGAPRWVRTVRLPVPGSTMHRDEIDYVVADDLPTLVWLANLAALELHVPQWRVGPRGAVRGADQVVFDLDPGAPAGLDECAEVAVELRAALAEDGLDPVVKTSGSKGMQMTAAVKESAPGRTSDYARSLAERLEKSMPTLVVSQMSKAVRPGKVFIDWSQNNPAKTTVAPYSLRGKDGFTASTPLRWEEVTDGGLRQFTGTEVVARVEEHGDLYADALSDAARGNLPHHRTYR
jgi:bifunctional non-homologous end joining protein LigD